MVRPALRAGNVKKKMVRVPSGETRMRVVKEKTKGARCAVCGKKLNAVPNDSSKLRKLPKTKKRPERMYGGVLCHSCLEKKIKQEVLVVE